METPVLRKADPGGELAEPPGPASRAESAGLNWKASLPLLFLASGFLSLSVMTHTPSHAGANGFATFWVAFLVLGLIALTGTVSVLVLTGNPRSLPRTSDPRTLSAQPSGQPSSTPEPPRAVSAAANTTDEPARATPEPGDISDPVTVIGPSVPLSASDSTRPSEPPTPPTTFSLTPSFGRESTWEATPGPTAGGNPESSEKAPTSRPAPSNAAVPPDRPPTTPAPLALLQVKSAVPVRVLTTALVDPRLDVSFEKELAELRRLRKQILGTDWSAP